MRTKMSHSKDKVIPLEGIPTAFEEGRKIIESKNSQTIEPYIDDLEKRKEKDEEAIIKLINNNSNSEFPLVEKTSIKNITYQEALKNLLRLQDPDTLEAMMLLYEYMNNKKNFKIDKLTGTELLKLGGYKGIRQIHRHRILERINNNSHQKITVLDPKQSVENYKNKNTNKGLVYKNYDLIRVKAIVYSKNDKRMIKELQGIEFLPEYIEHIHSISKRYIPMKAIRKIKKDNSKEKSRHFLYKICFKFAGIKKENFNLNLEECMNLGKFFNKNETSPRRKWKPIEKALIKGKEAGLIQFNWHFKNVAKENNDEEIQNNLFQEIDPEFNPNGTLKTNYYKYISSVDIIRNYPLNSPAIELPFNIEKEKPKNKKYTIEAIF